MGKSLLGDPDVVGDEIALRQPPFGEEQLARVRNLDERSIVETCSKAIR
jgi:hypothetical protein